MGKRVAGKAERAHEYLEEARWMVAGGQSDRARWGVVVCDRATGRGPSEGGEGCAQSSRSTREGRLK